MIGQKGKMHRVSLVLVLLCVAIAACLAGCASGTSGTSGSAGMASTAGASGTAGQSNAASAGSDSIRQVAVVTVEGYEPFEIVLDAQAAPKTVLNFTTLVGSGFYNGHTFYRFVEGFCMQGGSESNSAQSSGSKLATIPGEFSENGFDNPLADKFGRGTVAMARTTDPNSATSTFFVTLASSSSVSRSLDGKYAAFGTIDEAGMKVVDKIVADYLPKVSDSRSGAIADEADQARIVSIELRVAA